MRDIPIACDANNRQRQIRKVEQDLRNPRQYLQYHPVS